VDQYFSDGVDRRDRRDRRDVDHRERGAALTSTEHSVSAVFPAGLKRPVFPRQHRLAAYSGEVALRVITLLLAAVVMMTAATAQADLSSPDDVVSPADDSPDLDTPIIPAVVVVPTPDQRELTAVAPGPALDHGRAHAITVFRPPRRVASR
jgi:hypothetical protein